MDRCFVDDKNKRGGSWEKTGQTGIQLSAHPEKGKRKRGGINEKLDRANSLNPSGFS